MIFDMAGQRMYYHLHHVMMTKERSFYIVVISLAEPPNAPLSGEDAYSDMTCLENFHYWLGTIHGQAPDAPIAVLASKADLVTAEVREQRMAEINASLEKLFVKKPNAPTHIQAIIYHLVLFGGRR